MDLKTDISFLFFVKLIDYEYIKDLKDKNEEIITSSNLLKIKFKDMKDNVFINIGYKQEAPTTDNLTINIPYTLFNTKESNYVLINIQHNKEIQIYVNNKYINVQPFQDTDIKKNSILESIQFFNGFYGLCSTIMVYRNNAKNQPFYPEFLFEKTELNKINSEYTISNEYINGLFKEELLIPFVKAELMQNVEEKNIAVNDLINYNISDEKLIELKKFIANDLISLYIPTRTHINSKVNTKAEGTLFRDGIIREIVLLDSINNHNAYLNNNELYLNLNFSRGGGVHILSNIFQDLSIDLGGLNHLLPLIEVMTDYNELLSNDNLSNFMSIIPYFLNNEKLLGNEDNSQFFYYLSLFLERLPGEYFNLLYANITSILFSLESYDSHELFSKYKQEYFNNICLNEKILFKFNTQDRIKLYSVINNFLVGNSDMDININIIINILLYHDKDRYTYFCCKKHASYFNKESEIMEPELLGYIKPIINILELILLHQSKDKNFVDIEDSDLDKLMKIFKLLTLDITPCLQITIIKLFFNYLEKKTKDFDYLKKSDNINDIILILLFVYKKSFFNVKELVFKYLIELIEGLPKRNIYFEKCIKFFTINYYYPENEEKQEGLKYKEKIRINNIDYKLIELTANQKKLLSCYDKNHFKESMNNIFDKAENYFKEQRCPITNLNILILLASKGDYDNIKKLLDLIQTEIEKNNNQIIIEIILNNNKLLQFLLDTCYQAYLIKQSLLNKEEFIPGFSLCESTQEEKEKKADIIISLSSKILLNLFSKDIYKLDYLLTWSKYYNQIKDDKKTFASNRKFIFDSFLSKIINNFTDNKSKNKNDLPEKLFLINIIFEFLSFLRFESISSGGDLKETDSFYQEICYPFIYQLIHIIQDNPLNKNKNDEDNLYFLTEKWEDYPYIKKLLGNLEFLNLEQTNKLLCDESNVYERLIRGKNNMFVNELKIYFTDLSNNSTLCNLGTKLIIIKYHYYTLILTVLLHHIEFKEILNELSSFLITIIIASSTLSINHTKIKNNNKIKTNDIWPNENDYRSIQIIVKIVIFNILEFLKKYIDNINIKLSNYEKNLNDNKNKELFENYNTIKKYIVNVFLYILKLLYVMYEDVKKEEENKKKKKSYLKNIVSKVKNKFSTDKEGIKLTGGYSFIEEFMKNCIIEENDDINEIQNSNDDDNFAIIEPKKNFLDNVKLYSLNSINKKDYKSSDLSSQLVNIYEENIQNNKKIINYFDQNKDNYQKQLFPFVDYILKRDNLIQTIIPSYDNSIYTKNEYKYLCLKPDYVPELRKDSEKEKSLLKLRKDIINEIRMYQIYLDFIENDKIRKYRKIKKNLFSFNGILSIKKYFYDKKKYICKYRLFNHMTEDYTKIFLTPIIDIDYYLPKFSRFESKNLFRAENKDHLKQITKLADLSLKKKPQKEVKIEEKNESEKFNGLYLIKESEFSDIEEINKNIEGTLEHYNFYRNFIDTRHSITGNKNNLIINACLVKPEYHIRGFFYSNTKEIGFYSYDKIPYTKEIKSKKEDTDKQIDEIQNDYDPDRKSCFGSVFLPQTEKNDYFYFKIPYNKITFILKRRYYFKVSSLEIFTTDKKSFFFKLSHDKLDDILSKIKSHLNAKPLDISIEYNKFYSKIGFINPNSIENSMNKKLYQKNYMNLNELYDKWKKWEISTMRLLMLINIYANRSFNDVNQYPVFPWILTDYESDKLPENISKDILRPLDKPMGMLTINKDSAQRMEDYIALWEISKDDDDEDGFGKYGSHYSTSLYISYYLVRIFPFGIIRIEIQGTSFDDPNRLFNSMRASFDCSTSQKSDVRELIPELFCMPEILLNNNDFNLGEIKDSSVKESETESDSDTDTENTKVKMKEIQEVEMPKWCNNNAYDFIKKHREILESYQISNSINEWLNLIFGSKQKGIGANKIHNLFNYRTYEDYEPIFDKQTPDEQDINRRMLDFGITPNQIFKSNTSQRKMKLDQKIKNKLFFNTIENKKSGNDKTDNLIFEEIKYQINFFDAEKIYYFPKDKKSDNYRKNLYIMNNKYLNIYSRKMDKDIILSDKVDYNISPLLEDDIGQESLDEIKIKILEKKEETIDLTDFKYVINNQQPINWLEKGTIIVKGGYWNGNIIIKKIVKDNSNNPNKINDDEKNIFVYGTKEYSPITKIVIDKNETFALCGNSNGTIYVFKINQNCKYVWTLFKNVNNHNSPISSMAIHENLNIAITCSENGLCMLYSLPCFQLYNSFIIGKDDTEIKNDEEIIGPDVVLISDSSLPCFIFYIKLKNCLYFYSINGHLLKKQMLDFTIENNFIKIYTDYNFIDYLFVYNTKNKSFDLYSMIDFNLISSTKIENKDNNNKDTQDNNDNYNIVVDFILSEEMDHALILFKNEKEKESNYKIYVLNDSNMKFSWK